MNLGQQFGPVGDYHKVPAFENWIGPFVLKDKLEYKANVEASV
jgi:hypothetical protein